MTDSNPVAQNRPALSGRMLPLLLILFIGSGCAALIYEIVWLQLLQLVIGLTAASLGVLLGTFMGGMCLGSWLLPRLIPASRHPLRVYAMLELGIGVIGMLELVAVDFFGNIYTAHVGHGAVGIALRGVLAAICLLPPTILMGATLPAISRWVETSREGVSWLGFFYGGNIAGAVFGCLLAGFYLLRVHDMATATYVAAAINGFVALVALVLAAVMSYKPARAGAEADREEAVPMTGTARAAYVAIALSGLTALGAEVVWTRMLGLMLGATVYTFSIILAVFLIGLGIGSSLGALISRTVKRPAVALGVCQLLVAGAAGWCALMITRSLPNWPVNPVLATSPWYTFQMDLVMALWAILPAACLWGASFPLALAVAAERTRDPGRLVGGVYAANTVGAIVGALCFSLIVVPTGGTMWGQRLLILVSILSALVVLIPALFGSRAGEDRETGGASFKLAGAALLGGAAVFAIWLTSEINPLPWGVVAYGRFTATYNGRMEPKMLASEDKIPAGGNNDIFCTYMGEGYNGTVAVTVRTDGVRSFHSAGKVQASNDPHDMRLQRMLGHMAALTHPEPKSVLVVACGAGVTAGSFVVHPSVKRIVICDIEPLVPANVTPMFKKENYDVVNDPRVEIVHDDGRHFIRTTKEKFDVITSDPIDPWVKGCAALNTVSYYQACKEHLNPGGSVSLWIPLYESDQATIRSVLATFYQVFPNGVLWSNDLNGEGYDAVLFGTVDPMRIDVDKLQNRLDQLDHAAVKQSLDDVGFHSAVDLLSTYAGQARDLGPWLSTAQINTDRNLRLQYLAGMSVNTYMATEILNGIVQYYRFPDEMFTGAPATLDELKDKLNSAAIINPNPTSDTPATVKRRQPGAKFRIAGAIILLLGLGGAGARYWLSAPPDDSSEILSDSQSSKKVQRQMEMNFGKSALLANDLTEKLSDPGVQAGLIAGVSTLIAAGCFYVGHLEDRAEKRQQPK